MDAKGTIRHYEEVARSYAELIDPFPPPKRETALRGFVDALQPDGTVLEIGSGTGRDADFLESLGVPVHRTDGARAFADLQLEQGKAVAIVDVVADDLGGPYCGALAMCVLMHVPRPDIDRVLAKVAEALQPGGAFLVSVRRGSGESGGPAGMAFYAAAEFGAKLTAAGFAIDRSDEYADDEDDEWVEFLARRAR